MSSGRASRTGSGGRTTRSRSRTSENRAMTKHADQHPAPYQRARACAAGSSALVHLQPEHEERQQPEDPGVVEDVVGVEAGQEADGTATITFAGIRLKIGVTSRQKKSAERYHIGQCGSAQIARSRHHRTGGGTRRRRPRRSRRGPRPWSAATTSAAGPREGPREVSGHDDERRDVPGVEEVVGPVVPGVVRKQRPRVADHDQHDQDSLRLSK